MPNIQINQATSIVSEIGSVLPCELAISNAEGIIIAGSDANKVGKTSKVALRCLVSGERIQIDKPDDDQQIGITSPLIFETQIFGTITLFGNPKMIMPYVELVRITAELLISQEHQLHIKQQKRQSINEYLQEWLFRTQEYPESFLARGRILGIQVDLDYFVAVISNIADMEMGLSNIRAQLQMGDYWYAYNAQGYVIITRKENTIHEKLNAILKSMPECIIGVGQQNQLLCGSFNGAMKAMEIGQVLEPDEQIHYYEKLEFFHKLAMIGDERMINMIKRLYQDTQGQVLVQTILCYIKNQCEIISTSKMLYIHRNTLKYRLEKICSITGKDPRCSEDLFYLFTAIINYLLMNH